MNWNTVNREEARKDSFGAGLESGAYTINIEEAHIFKSPQSDFKQITLKAKVNGGDKYLKLVTTGADGAEGYDSKRVVQLCFLLGKKGTDIQEVPANRDNVFAIPQLVGKVGCVIEVRPAISCKPNDEGKQYPDYKVVQFFNSDTGKTIAETIDKKEASKVSEIVEKLKTREYKPYNNGYNNSSGQSAAPQQFTVDNNGDSSLPF